MTITNENAVDYKRADLVNAINTEIKSGTATRDMLVRLGEFTKNAVVTHQQFMDAVSSELVQVIYERGYSDAGKAYFPGSFKSSVRLAMKRYGIKNAKIRYRTQGATANHSRLVNGKPWTVDVELTAADTFSEEQFQKIQNGEEITPLDASDARTDSQQAIDKAVGNDKVDKAELLRAALQAVSVETASHIIADFMDNRDIKTMAALRKLAEEIGKQKEVA